MAYTPETLCAGIVPDANGASLFTYLTADTKADVIVADYFADGTSTALASTVLSLRDIVMCQCADGLQVLIVNALSNTTIATSAKWVEA